LLADTIYTLTSGPGATLGPAVLLDAPHPRSRLQLSGQAGYHKARRDTLAMLTGAAPAAAVILH
jgi:hypothetical protein